MKFYPLFSVLLTSIILSCENKKESGNEAADLLSQRAAFEIAQFPANIQPADTVYFSAQLTDSSQRFDSIVLVLDKKNLGKLSPGELTYRLSCGELGMGRHEFRLAGFSGGKENASAASAFFLHSDTEPESLTYQVVKSLPHNPGTFTQGLEWYQGRLYEGSGLNGKSAVMEINPANGEVLRKTTLPQEHFGEGISILNGQLYQLTWQSHRAFVYSLPDLSQKATFGYPTEGWGLCHLNGELVMSDGTEKLYFLNPKDFSLIRSIEVWDRKNPVMDLNELEAAEGFIYANKYQTDTIVKIDPVKGKVVAYVNMEGLLKTEDRKGNEDVLNGIALNPSDKLWYVTGKNWPKLFGVKWVRRKPA